MTEYVCPECGCDGSLEQRECDRLNARLNLREQEIADLQAVIRTQTQFLRSLKEQLRDFFVAGNTYQ